MGDGVGSSSGRILARIATIGVMVAVLGLAGCGRKSGLDLPPSAAISAPNGAAPNGSAPSGAVASNNGKSQFDPVTGQPIAPASVSQKTHFLDFLID
jgi:predicted small lipoprotein YifL